MLNSIDMNLDVKDLKVENEKEPGLDSFLNEIPFNFETSVPADGENQSTSKPKRKNKTQRKYERYLNQVKKFKEKKEQKKKLEKAKRQEELANAQASETTTNAENEDETYENKIGKRQMKKIRTDRLKEIYAQTESTTTTATNNNHLKICIDCSFSDKMSNKELARLAQQIGRCYAVNKSLDKPVHLTLCNLDKESKLYAELCRINCGFSLYVIETTDRSIEQHYGEQNLNKISYLSPDAKTQLETLDLESVYVIGGLVDETVSKKVTLAKCEKLNIQTYSLPIEKYMTRKTVENVTFTYNKILTVNQVFEILADFYANNDWKKALDIGVPKRKGFVVSTDNHTNS